MSLFRNYIGIDYSGAVTATEPLKGLRIFAAMDGALPVEVLPPAHAKRSWTRQGIADHLITFLLSAEPTLVGIDHGFSFPEAYFKRHGLARNWDDFLEDFCRHWPTDEIHTYVDFIREGVCGNGAARRGNSRWRRLCEMRTRGAKSVFHFDCPGSVAKSTHAGLPWLRRIRSEPGIRAHFWPFDGWTIPEGRHVFAEIYPSLWRGHYPVDARFTSDQKDACTACLWLQETDRSGLLGHYLRPILTPKDATIASYEGWILGVM